MTRDKEKSLKEFATELKGEVNAIIWDWGINVTEVEFKTLYNLVYYLDVFLLECLDKDGNLINKIWIQKKLIMCVILLGSSKRAELRRVMDKVVDLENMIYLEKISNGNKNSDS